MKDIMILNHQHQLVVQDTRQHLPEELHQANAAEIPVSLQDQDIGLPGELFCKVNLL